ncbi:MAG: DNA polymerase I, partial [Bdellovibrionales bacterium]|nr:DNA polymerase I [Bdellovibrionales bacterium]
VEKFGVPPEKVVEYLALAGDSSDNIPGLKGAGPKTAAKLIELFGDVETILESAGVIAEEKAIRGRKKLSEQIELDPEIVRLSRQLVEIRKDVPVLLEVGQEEVRAADLTQDDLYSALKRNSPDMDSLHEIMERFDFHSLLKDFKPTTPRSAPLREEATYTPVTKANFDEFCASFLAQKEFCFDLETTSLDVLEAQIVGIALCWSDSQAYYIPVAHTGVEDQISLDHFKERCGAHFADSSVKKVGQNLKFDVAVCLTNGITVNGVAFDTMIAAYLLHPDKGGYGLTALAKEHLGHRMIEFDDVAGDVEHFGHVALEHAVTYACEDAHVTWLLKNKLAPLIEEAELREVFSSIEMPLVAVLAHMERRGVCLDVPFLEEMSKDLSTRMEKAEKEIYEIAGCEFNVQSPKQLSEVLFEKLGIPTKGIKKTKTGYSTNQSVLERLRESYEVPDLILAHRSMSKLRGTYVDALPSQISPVTGRLHTRYNQTVTATGRLSSSHPNLQNIPIQTEEGRKVRKAFIAKPGHVLLSADYSQIELRLLAHLSGDENLQNAFLHGEDVHSKTARELLSLSEDEEVGRADRRLGKTINFGIVYGMSGFRLAKQLDIPVFTANEYIEQYFARYPKVREYFDHLESLVEQDKAVRTLFGRRRLPSEIDSDGRDRGFVQRAALNAPLQGSAADIIKLAMVRLEEKCTQLQSPPLMLMQIHDELVFECEQANVEECADLVRTEMEGVVELAIPLKVDISWGANWDEAH